MTLGMFTYDFGGSNDAASKVLGLHRFRRVTSRTNRLWIQIQPAAVKVNGVAKTLPVAKSARLSFDALNAAVHAFLVSVVTL